MRYHHSIRAMIFANIEKDKDGAQSGDQSLLIVIKGTCIKDQDYSLDVFVRDSE